MDEFDISEYLGGGMDTGGFNFDTSGIEGLDLSQFTGGGMDTGGFDFNLGDFLAELEGMGTDLGPTSGMGMDQGLLNDIGLGDLGDFSGGGFDTGGFDFDRANQDALERADALKADNRDVGGGYNPATGKGDATTAEAARQTGVTSSASTPHLTTPYGVTPTPTKITPSGPSVKIDPKTGTPVKKGMDPSMMMMLMLLLSQMGKGGGGGGSSQASIPALSASRSQLPYSPPSRPGAGGTTYFSPMTYAPRMAGGGEIAMASGGISSLGGYSDGGRLLKGPGDGVSDGIPATIAGKQPARLANGEFVVPARIVSELGNGSTEAGADRLYAMMDRVQKARRKTKNVAADTKAHKYLPA
jgi:hypothetical protein